jgi:4-hydroxy-tetrahydrodipicolinate synthase
MSALRSVNLRQDYGARGVYVFVMTPFKRTTDRRGKYGLDLAGMEGNCRYFASVPGDRTLVICGGSGEFHSLSSSEVIALAEAATAGAAGGCQVVMGVGGTTRNAVAMAQRAQTAGCDAVLVLPHPPEVKRGDKVLYERHRAIARAIDIGLIPFRAPAQLLAPELIARLEKFANVVAIKEESNAVDWVRKGIRMTAGKLPIVTGGGENMVPYYYLAGAVGFTTGMANIALARSVDLHNAAMAHDWAAAMEWRDYFEPLTDMRGQLGNSMLKGGLEMLGLAGGPIRASGDLLDATGRRSVRRLMKQKGLL